MGFEHSCTGVMANSTGGGPVSCVQLSEAVKFPGGLPHWLVACGPGHPELSSPMWIWLVNYLLLHLHVQCQHAFSV